MSLTRVLATFANARDAWMRQFLVVLAAYSAEFKPSGPEVLVELSDNGSPRVFRLYRADMASGATTPPNFREVNLPPIVDVGAREHRLPSGLAVQLHPIHWNGVEFLVDRLQPRAVELQTWSSKWLDSNELGKRDEDGLLGVIHSVTAPEPREGGVSFAVDFGSAPAMAVEELLQVLHRSGATQIRISSPWGYETSVSGQAGARPPVAQVTSITGTQR